MQALIPATETGSGADVGRGLVQRSHDGMPGLGRQTGSQLGSLANLPEALGVSSRHAQVHSRLTNPVNSDVSTADTIQQMVTLARNDSQSPIVQSAIAQALSRTGSNTSPQSVADALFWFVKRTVTFTTDEGRVSSVLGIETTDKELLISPQVLLSMPKPMGDCDDFSMLLASMLVGAGIGDVYFTTVAIDESEPDRWSHVYVKVVIPRMGSNGMISDMAYCLDSSHGPYPGWATDGIYRLYDWPVETGVLTKIRNWGNG